MTTFITLKRLFLITIPTFLFLTATVLAVEPIATTTAGSVRGYVDDQKGINIFKGIHYGESTAGENRFRLPIPVKPWSGVKDALDFGDACPQVGGAGLAARSRDGSETQVSMSEDCLVLNVWTPGLDDNRRPVMLWLHGRGFSAGAGSEPMYDGTNLAMRGDVVVVTINHRLGVLGYLYVAEIGGEEYAGSGLSGMLDAELALKWVRDNIEDFGGDPHNVTIFGESGGGAKVSTMLAMPSAKALFKRGIIQSGPGLRAIPAETAARNAKKVMELLSVDRVADLKKVPFEKIMEANRNVSRGIMGTGPVVDGHFLPVHPFDPVASPSSVGKPVIVGTNRDEGLLFNIRHPKAGKMTMDELKEDLKTTIGDGWEDVLNTYRFSRPNASPWDLFIAINSEGFRRRSMSLAELVAANGTPAYMYLFEFEVNSQFKASHGVEIVYAFSNASEMSQNPNSTIVEDAMSDAWVSFARNGDPNHPGLAHWPVYTKETRATMIFDAPSRTINDPRREERMVWDKGIKMPGP